MRPRNGWLACVVGGQIETDRIHSARGHGPLVCRVERSGGSPNPWTHRTVLLRQWIRDIFRGVRSAVWLALFEWTTVALLWAMGLLVPVLSPFTLTLAWLVGAWAYGASVMDYVWERQGKGLFRLAVVAAPHGCGARVWCAVFALDVHPCVGLDSGAVDGRDGSHRCGLRGLDRSGGASAGDNLNLHPEGFQVVEERGVAFGNNLSTFNLYRRPRRPKQRRRHGHAVVSV